MADKDDDLSMFEDDLDTETEETVEETEEDVEEESKVDEESEEETSEETEEETEDSTETTSEEQDEEKVEKAFKQAYMDEKRKRQRLEERLDRLESQIPKQEEELPDPIDDPEGYEQAIRAKVQRELDQQNQKERIRKIEESRTKMLESKPDFTKMEQIFDIIAVDNPSIRQEMLESADPVAFAYNKAKEYHDEVMRPEKVLTTEMPDESEFEDKPRKSSKPNLAKASAGASNKVVVEKDLDLDDEELFADLKY